MYILPLVLYLKLIADLQKLYFSNFLGYDERYHHYPNIFKNDDNATLDKITGFNKNTTLLNILESNLTTVQTKLDVICDSFDDRINPGIYNLFEGGLMDDWNFPDIAE